MKKRLIALTLSALLLLGTVGCATVTPPDDPSVPGGTAVAQMAVAVNPFLVYDNGDTVIAYNDIKNAAGSDYAASTHTALADNGWMWVTKETAGWRQRAVHGLGRWYSGNGATAKNHLAYAFTANSAVSLMSYHTGSHQLTPYGGDVLSEYGLLLSVTGVTAEGLCYTVKEAGVLNIPTGTVTAVDTVAGLITGYLDDESAPRRATVRLTVNELTLWSGQLTNAAGSADGEAVTTLTYPTLTDIPVKAGDRVFLTVTLGEEPLPAQPTEGTTTTTAPTTRPVTRPTGTPPPVAQPEKKPEPLPLLDGYDSRFVVTFKATGNAEQRALAQELQLHLQTVLDTEVNLRANVADPVPYEIQLGLCDRDEAAAVHKELTAARQNNAADYIIRRVGNKVAIVGGSDVALRKAVEYFMATYCKDDESVIPATLNVTYRPNLKPILLGKTDITKYTITIERYPSVMVQRAAEDLQEALIDLTGVILPIKKLKTGNESVANRIALGPQKGEVNAIFSATTDRITGIEDSGLLEKELGTGGYRVTMEGSTLTVNGGSAYAINAATHGVIAHLQGGASYARGYSKTGSYGEGYTLSDGYGLTFADEFNYNEGSDNANDKAIRKNWKLSNDTTTSFDLSPQIRNGVYGEDYFLRDGCLVEVTRKKLDGPGYHAVRLTSEGFMNFRYGFLELRLVMGTRNGACSAIWMAGDGLNQTNMPEIDINENYAIDAYWPCLHSWPKDGKPHIQFISSRQNNAENPPVVPEEGEHFWDTFHYLGMEWEKDYIAFYLDGQPTLTVDTSGPRFTNTFRQSIVLKLANGVSAGADYGILRPDELLDDVNKFYEEQLIDSVRIYQKNDGEQTIRKR